MYVSTLDSEIEVQLEKPIYSIGESKNGKPKRNDIHNNGTINVKNGAVIVMDGGITG